jgi:hypothetical protein
MRVRLKDIQEAIYSPKSGVQRHIQSLTEKPQSMVFTMVGLEDDRQDLHGQSSDDGYPVLYQTDKVRKDGIDGIDTIEDLPAENRNEAYAKRIIHHGIDNIRMIKYYVKRGAHGRLFNPVAVIDDDPRHLRRRIGSTEWVFREVNQKVFMLYLNFLKTKNQAYLRNAQREVV